MSVPPPSINSGLLFLLCALVDPQVKVHDVSLYKKKNPDTRSLAKMKINNTQKQVATCSLISSRRYQHRCMNPIAPATDLERNEIPGYILAQTIYTKDMKLIIPYVRVEAVTQPYLRSLWSEVSWVTSTNEPILHCSQQHCTQLGVTIKHNELLLFVFIVRDGGFINTNIWRLYTHKNN